MANVQVKETVKSFKLELNEAELKTIIAGINSTHNHIEHMGKKCGYKASELLTPRENYVFWQQLRDAVKGEF
jgi:hypothetical protein